MITTTAATEEIIVSGDNFIERRIILYPEQKDIEDLQASAFVRGYTRGWHRGFLLGISVIAVAAICIWLALNVG